MASGRSAVASSIDRAIAFLQGSQLRNGEFRLYASTERAMYGACRGESSPCVAAHIVHAARFIDDSRMAEIRRTAVAFLVREMQGTGLWSFWSSSVAHNVEPDIFSTSLIAFELRDRHAEFRSGSIHSAMLTNRDEQGRFRTFFRPLGEPNDVDSVVNASALFYLGERPETEDACAFVNDVILEDREAGSFAHVVDHLALYYAASRAYFVGVHGLSRSREAMLSKVCALRQADGGFGDELATGLAISTLLNLGFDDLDVLDRAARLLLIDQCGKGSWLRSAMFAGSEPPAPPSIWLGSDELTTAICLEALSRCAALDR